MKLPKISRDTVSLIVAVAAVLISAASFYATYLQSVAATRQVKAATWPYVQIEHGNFDEDERVIFYVLRNVGVGPLHLQSLELSYQGERIEHVVDLIRACCIEPGEDGGEPELPKEGPAVQLGRQVISSPASPRIIPEGDAISLFRIKRSEANAVAWDQLDRARWVLDAKLCYCSILDECWEIEGDEPARAVAECPQSDGDAYWR